MNTVGAFRPQWPIALAALAIGALLAAPYFIRVLSASINIDVLATVLEKLLVARNPSRAIKLTNAAPQSPHCTAVRAALYACRDGLAFPAREPTDYRSGAFDASPPQVMAMVRARYDQAFDAAMRPITRVRVPAAIAVIPLLAALCAPLWLSDVPVALPSLAGLGLLGLVFAARTDRRGTRSAPVLFHKLGEGFTVLALNPDAFSDMPRSDAREYWK